MSPAPDQTRAELDDEATRHYRGVLRMLVDLGSKMAADIAHDASASQQPGTPTPDLTYRFDRISRTIRRCILLDRKLAEPLPQPRPAKNPSDRTAARKRIIRGVEDSIDLMRQTHDVDVESLEAELLDRLDRPDIEDDLATRPIGEIIADLARDLGVGKPLDDKPFRWKRRTPEDIETLEARAAEPLPPRLHSGKPRSPRTATRAPPPLEKKPPEDPAQTAAMLLALETTHDADL